MSWSVYSTLPILDMLPREQGEMGTRNLIPLRVSRLAGSGFGMTLRSRMDLREATSTTTSTGYDAYDKIRPMKQLIAGQGA